MTDFMNEYCMHTATCGELRKGDVGREVVLCGWAWHNRDHGGLIFVDLRDRAGYTQVVVDPDCVSADDFAKAEHLGREYVLKIAGTVRERGAEAVNPNMATGEIEVLAKSVEVLNTSVTPPFSIEDGIETDETTRMKWRYLDIRRPEMYQALHLRHKVAQAMRGALNERGFLEVETPILANSTPEGARDYIVPSRPNPGRFYALPQSPQQFKQMLMVGGIERYYQIARCFRDEDLRADRQPEFTQVDIEMGFVQGEDVMNLMEDVMAETLAAVGVEHAFPLQRMQYRESMDRFGNDRPDTRFGMELVDITDIVKNTGFKVFSSVAQSGGVVKAINAKGAGDWSRGDVEKLADIAAENGAKGMAWIAFTTDGKEKSPIIKFFSDEEFAALKEAMDVEPGDLLLFAADTYEVASAVLSALRLHMADALNVPREGHQLLWVVNFPMFKYDEDEKKYAAEHHPFTHVLDEDVDKIESDPLACGSYSYDLVMDGFEVGGGTIRIHNAEEQRRILRVVGLTDDEIDEKFGHLIRALELGAPRGVSVPDPRCHAFRHAADDEIVVIGLQQPVVENFFDRLLLLNAVVVGAERRIDRFEKFPKVQRRDVEQIHHADRIGFRCGQKRAEQAPGRDDVVFVCFFFEILQRVQSLRAFLDLVEDQERLSRQNFLAADHGQQLDDALRIFVRLKDGLQLRLLIEVEIDGAFIAAPAEFLHQPCLADLSCPAQDKGLPFFVVFPIDHGLNCIAFHTVHRPFPEHTIVLHIFAGNSTCFSHIFPV